MRIIQLLLPLVLLGSATALEAQIFTPTYYSGDRSSVGVYFSNAPGDIAAEGIWRARTDGLTFGLRAGLTDTADLAGLFGAEFQLSVLPDAPIDVEVTGAGQAIVAAGSALGGSIGLALSGMLTPEGFGLRPYVHPRLAYIDGRGGAGTDLKLLVEMGAMLEVSRRLAFHLAFGFDDSAELGFGTSWR